MKLPHIGAHLETAIRTILSLWTANPEPQSQMQLKAFQYPLHPGLSACMTLLQVVHTAAQLNTRHIWDNTHLPFSLESPPSEWCRHSFYGLASLLFNAQIFFSATRRYWFFFFNLDKYLNNFSGMSVTLIEGQSLSVACIFQESLLLSVSTSIYVHFYSSYISAFQIFFPSSHMEIIQTSPNQPDGFYDNRWIFGKNINFHSCTKKMVSDFQILSYTDKVSFLEENFMKRWQAIYVIFVSLVFSICCKPSAFILLSLILSGTQRDSPHSLIFINDNSEVTITSSSSM